MNQIMRLRRRATRDYEIKDHNNGYRHEQAFTKIIEKKGILDERKLARRTASAPLRPAGRSSQLLRALPTGLRGFARGKVTPRKALFHERLRGTREHAPHLRARREPRASELNLYIVGEGGDEDGGRNGRRR